MVSGGTVGTAVPFCWATIPGRFARLDAGAWHSAVGRRDHGRPERGDRGAHARGQDLAFPEAVEDRRRETAGWSPCWIASWVRERVDSRLYRIDRRDTELLAILMVDHLSVLRGTERERLVEFAQEIGLVGRYFVWLNAHNRWRKARAAENLGYSAGPRRWPIERLLSHPDETVRAVSARALARIGTPDAAEALARTLNDPSELTRLRMAENLERLGPLATDPLLETLEGGDPSARVLAARILGNLRAAEAGPAFVGR